MYDRQHTSTGSRWSQIHSRRSCGRADRPCKGCVEAAFSCFPLMNLQRRLLFSFNVELVEPFESWSRSTLGPCQWHINFEELKSQDGRVIFRESVDDETYRDDNVRTTMIESSEYRSRMTDGCHLSGAPEL